MDAQNTGVGIPEILLPNLNVNMKKWSVIACDQFTSQPDYWTSVEKLVGSAPSILHMILPEVYLNYEGLPENIESIKTVMNDYLDKGILEQLPRGIMLTERVMGNVVRKGLVMTVDLESYDYRSEKKPMIRATEKTLLERIPPRVTIRQEAPLETSHVMILMDDVQGKVIGPLYDKKEEFEKMYDFDLMMGGGRIRGYFIEKEDLLKSTLSALASLPARNGMRFCVGDGNHSLAAAKSVWELAKEGLSEEEQKDHPLRYAMCEFVNIHDDGIQFMPIHRVLFKVNPSACVHYIADKLNKRGAKAKILFGRWRGGSEAQKGTEIPFLYRDGAGRIIVEHKNHPLILEDVQDILEEFLKENPSSDMDYIHGQEVFEEMARAYDNMGLYFPAIPKEHFFSTLIESGVLPQKSFSMGEAEQKRYYVECRMIAKPKEEAPPAEESAGAEKPIPQDEDKEAASAEEKTTADEEIKKSGPKEPDQAGKEKTEE
jgi:uncharacterized protein (DUF1015 family)